VTRPVLTNRGRRGERSADTNRLEKTNLQTSAGVRQRSATFKSASVRNGGGCRDSFETRRCRRVLKKLTDAMRVLYEQVTGVKGLVFVFPLSGSLLLLLDSVATACCSPPGLYSHSG
jgi:hypothetical protein